MITIIIENVTSQQKDFTVTTAFNLGLLKYWSPVKLAKESELLPPNTSFDLSIGAGTQLRYEIDLTKFKWAESVSSFWPSDNLFAVVPPGKYKLSFDIGLGTNTNPNWIRSNEIEIVVQ